uniref:Cystatin domain-containing protein n=1 Tax=Panagrolaimus sp. JU765 TaxID=591449 RepID=A0AC34QDC3_9BILA
MIHWFLFERHPRPFVSRRSVYRMFVRAAFFICLFSFAMAGDTMVGGWTKQDVNSKEVKDLVNKVVTKYNAESNDMFYHVPVEVVSAESQVVAGVQYKIKMVLAQSSCAKNQVGAEDFNINDCEEKDNSNRKDVTAVIWSKPWENFEQITFE